MEISVSNNNFIVVGSSGTLTIPIDAIEKFTAKHVQTDDRGTKNIYNS